MTIIDRYITLCTEPEHNHHHHHHQGSVPCRHCFSHDLYINVDFVSSNSSTEDNSIVVLRLCDRCTRRNLCQPKACHCLRRPTSALGLMRVTVGLPPATHRPTDVSDDKATVLCSLQARLGLAFACVCPASVS